MCLDISDNRSFEDLCVCVCVCVKVSDSGVGMVCIVTRCGQECDVLECIGCSLCPIPLFLHSALCPHLMLHSTQFPLVAPQTFCSGLLCVSGFYSLFYSAKKQTVFIRVHLLTVFILKYLVKMFSQLFVCNLFCQYF